MTRTQFSYQSRPHTASSRRIFWISSDAALRLARSLSCMLASRSLFTRSLW